VGELSQGNTPTNIHFMRMDNSMFTRSELEIKTLGELKGLCKQYGLKPLGNPGYKTAWIDALLTFAAIALRQMKEGEGLRRMVRFVG
jgi:hypothetical protein